MFFFVLDTHFLARKDAVFCSLGMHVCYVYLLYGKNKKKHTESAVLYITLLQNNLIYSDTTTIKLWDVVRNFRSSIIFYAAAIIKLAIFVFRYRQFSYN